MELGGFIGVVIDAGFKFEFARGELFFISKKGVVGFWYKAGILFSKIFD